MIDIFQPDSEREDTPAQFASVSIFDRVDTMTEDEVEAHASTAAQVSDDRNEDEIRDQLLNLGKTRYHEDDKVVINKFRDEIIIGDLSKKDVAELADFAQFTEQNIADTKFPSAVLVGMAGDGTPGTSDDMYKALMADRWARAIDEVSARFPNDGYSGATLDFFTSIYAAPANFLVGNWFWDNKAVEDLWVKSRDPSFSQDELVDELAKLFEKEVDTSDPFADRNWFYFQDFLDVAAQKGLGDKVTPQMVLNAAGSLFGVPGGALGLKATTALVRGGSRTLAGVAPRGKYTSWLTGRFASGKTNPGQVYSSIPTAGKFPELPNGPMDFDIVSAGVQAGRNSTTQNQLAAWLRSIRFRNPIDVDKLKANYDKIVATFYKDILPKRAMGSRLLNAGLIKGDRYGVAATQEGNLVGWGIFGHASGKPFKLVKEDTLAPGTYTRIEGTDLVLPEGGWAADALKRAGPDAKLVWLGNDEAAIVKAFSLDASKFGDDLVDPFVLQQQRAINDTAIGHLADALFSTAGRLDKQTVSAFLQSEAIQGRVTKELKELVSGTFGQLNKQELANLDTFLKSITDGEWGVMSRHMTDAEVNLAWHTKFGRPATDAERAAYRTMTEIDDIVWSIEADRVLKEYIDQGFDRVFRVTDANGNTQRLIARPADNIPRDEFAINAADGTIVRAEDMDRTKGMWFETSTRHGYQHASGREFRNVWVPNSEVGRAGPIGHVDALGWRPGFSRQYVGANAFVKQDTVIRTGGGTGKRAGKPKTLGYANTPAIAERAANSINEILGFVRKALPQGKRLSHKEVVARLKQAGPAFRQSIKTVLAKNNHWGGDVDDLDELIKFIDEEGINVYDDVTIALKGETIRVADPDEAGKFLNFGGSWGDPADRVVSGTSSRSHKPLRNMSGDAPETLGGYEALFNSAQKSLFHRSWSAALDTEAKRWWEAAKGKVKNPEDLEKLPAMARLRAAELNPSEGTGVARLEQARKDILRTFGQEDKWGDTWFQKLGDTLAELILDAKALKRMGIEKVTDARLAEGVRSKAARLPDELRKLAFNMKLGLYNPVQLMVQASQMVQVMAIEPRYSMRALPLAVAMRAYRVAGPAARKEIIERTWKLAGLKSADEAEDFFELMEQSGRLDIGGSIADKGGMLEGPKLDQPSAWATIRNNHRMFFEEGERWPRILAGATTYLKKLDELGADTLARKSRAFQDDWWRTQDDLTFNMTSALSAPWQRSNLSVTFQFMTYMTRTAEMILRKNGLTVGQKARLIAGNVLAYGGTGLGVAGLMEESKLSGGWASGVDDESYQLLRHGAIGAMWNAAGLGDVSTRVAPAQGLLDWWNTFSEDSFVEVVSGPGGGIIRDVSEDSWAILTNLYNYQGTTTKQDVAKLATNISSASNALKLYYAIRYNQYFNRSGELVASEMDGADAVSILLGVDPKDVGDAYRSISAQKAVKQGAIEAGKMIGTLMDQYSMAREEGDVARATNIRDQIFAAIAPMSPWERKKAERFWRSRYESLFESVMARELEISSQTWLNNSDTE